MSFLAHLLNFCKSSFKIVLFGVCLLTNNLIMCHQQKVGLNQSIILQCHLYRLKVAGTKYRPLQNAC